MKKREMAAEAVSGVSVAHEARTLVHELQKVQATLKSGSVEREQSEDRIYQRLYQLADTIRTRHPRDPQLQEIFFVITNQGTPASAPSVPRLPVYTDEFKLFTQSPTTPKVQLFLEKMAQDLQALPAAHTHTLLADGLRDGPKDVLRSFVSKCHRERWLKESSELTCKGCWTEVMRYVFMMAIEMLTLELKQRAHQIRVMTAQGNLTEVDANELAKHAEHIILEADRLLARSEKPRLSKKDWIELLEALFRLLVGLINDLMMRYVQFMTFRKENNL